MQWFNQKEELEDLYYLSIRLGIEKKAQELGFELTKVILKEEEIPENNYDGVLALGKFDATQVAELKALGSEILFIDFDATSYDASSLVVDFERGVELALKALHVDELTEITMLSGIEKTKNSEEELLDPRLKVFVKLLKDKKKEFNVYLSSFTVEGGYKKMKEVLETGTIPKALFCASDTLAIGASKAILEAGLKIPQDIALVGFNDISVSKYVTPALSTIKVHTDWMGEKAVLLIAEQMKENYPLPVKTVLGVNYVKRDSTK